MERSRKMKKIFLALSQVENIPLITADYRFVKKIKDIENVMKLSELQL